MNKSLPLPGNSQSRANHSNAADKKMVSGVAVKQIPSASAVNGGNSSAAANVSDPSNGENRKKGLITGSHHTPGKKKSSVGKSSNPDGTATSASAGVDGYDSAHDEEARNNLYWVGRHECMCLWYGVIEKNSQFVTVLPIGTTTDLSGHEITTARDGDKTLEVLQVKRSRLIPLDEEVLHSSCANDMLRDFGLALLIFADWDDYARDSYVWPEFINRLMGSRHGLESWFRMSVMHPLANRLGTQASRAKFFFFLLCAEHRGITGEYIATDRFVRGMRMDTCSVEVLDLIMHISQQRPGTSDMRSTSRSGKQFQAVIVNKANEAIAAKQALIDSNCSVSNSSSDAASTGSEPVWRPGLQTDEVVTEYLDRVATARLAHVRVGQLLEAPTAEWMLKTPNCDVMDWCAGVESVDSAAPAQAEEGQTVSVKREPQTTESVQSTLSDSMATTSTSASNVLRTDTSEACEEDTDVCVDLASSTSAGSGGDMAGLEADDGSFLTLTTQSSVDLTLSQSQSSGAVAAAKKGRAKKSITCCVVHMGRLLSTSTTAPAIVALQDKTNVQSDISAPLPEVAPPDRAETLVPALVPQSAVIMSSGEPNDPPWMLDVPPAEVQPLVQDNSPPSESLTPEVQQRPASPLTCTPTPIPTPAHIYDLEPTERGAWVTVYDGRDQWSVPVKFCRAYNLSTDQALVLLQKHNYNPDAAMAEVNALLGAQSEHDGNAGGHLLSNQAGFTKADMDAFMQIAQRHPRNIRKIWTRFNSRGEDPKAVVVRAKDGKEKEKEKEKVKEVTPDAKTADSGGASSLPTSGRTVTLREITALYFLFFQGFTDLEDTAGNSVSTAEHRSLSRITTNTRRNHHWGIPSGSAGYERVAQVIADYQLSKADLTHIFQRVARPANSWPKNVPMNRYNVYWVRSNSQPCVCLDFEPEKMMVTIVPICCATYHHEIRVHISNLAPISAHLLKICPDERAASFTMAMMDFARWELAQFECHVVRWYRYPKFIMHFFAHGPTFSSWRKNAERAVRGSALDKRRAYLDKLLEDYVSADGDESVRLNAIHSFPFDDISEQSSADESPSSSESEAEAGLGLEGDKGKIPIVAKKRSKPEKKSDDGSAAKKKAPRPPKPAPEPEPEPEPELEYPQPNEYNLFWSPKSNLPCIFYDSVQNLHQWSITVIPICCSTYHYKVSATRTMGQLESLTCKHMDLCTDERTSDFTFAMIDFSEWHRHRLEVAMADGGEVPTVRIWGNAPSVVDGIYMWPTFIVELLEKPQVWAAWRKKAERAAVGGTRRLAYLQALCADFQEYAAEYKSVPPPSTPKFLKPDQPVPRILSASSMEHIKDKKSKQAAQTKKRSLAPAKPSAVIQPSGGSASSVSVSSRPAVSGMPEHALLGDASAVFGNIRADNTRLMLEGTDESDVDANDEVNSYRSSADMDVPSEKKKARQSDAW